MIYYSLITIFLAAADALRIRWKNKRIKHPVGNNDISHPVSWTLGVVSAIILWLATYWLLIDWTKIILFACGCGVIRVIAFDPFLNLFRRLPIDNISGKSNSKTERGWGKVPFWWRRIIGVGVLVSIVILQFFLKK